MSDYKFHKEDYHNQIRLYCPRCGWVCTIARETHGMFRVAGLCKCDECNTDMVATTGGIAGAN